MIQVKITVDDLIEINLLMQKLMNYFHNKKNKMLILYSKLKLDDRVEEYWLSSPFHAKFYGKIKM